MPHLVRFQPYLQQQRVRLNTNASFSAVPAVPTAALGAPHPELSEVEPRVNSRILPFAATTKGPGITELHNESELKNYYHFNAVSKTW